MNDDLIIKYLVNETSPEEEAQIREWISSDPENAKEFSRFELIWLSSKNLEEISNKDPDVAWDKFRARVSQAKTGEVPVRSITRRYNWLKIAAVLFITVGAWAFYSLTRVSFDIIETGKIVRTEILPDGSEVTLNRNTMLSYRRNFKGDTRSVKLESGEVFFNVRPDKSKPFIIEADDVSIIVVGTSFNVKHINHGTEVIVESGVVRVSMNDQTVELKPGEKISVTDKNAILRKEANTDQLYTYYRSKMFVADNTPLWRVIEILNEAYDSNIIIENDQIRNLPLSTTFKDESLDTIIHVITETFKISAVKENGKIVLR